MDNPETPDSIGHTRRRTKSNATTTKKQNTIQKSEKISHMD